MSECGLFAQLNAPSTVDGIGLPADQLPNAFAASSGLESTITPAVGINFLNPATYGSFNATNFDIGLQIDNSIYQYRRFMNAPTDYTFIRFSNVHIGFPLLKNKLGLVIGAYPFSFIGYNLKFDQPVTASSVGDSFTSTINGYGGSYVLHMGLGYKINPYISVGFNVGYLWGSKNTEATQVLFGQDITTSSHRVSILEQDLFFGSILTTFGAVASIPFRTGAVVKIGGAISIPFKADAYWNGYWGSQLPYGTLMDTIAFYDKTTVDITLPISYRTGISYTNTGGNFMVGIQYQSTAWSQYLSSIQHDSRLFSIKDDYYVSLGLSYRPARDQDLRVHNYFSYITYSLGAFYGENRLYDMDTKTSTDKYGFSLGFLFPVKRYNYSTQFGGISFALRYAIEGTETSKFTSSTFTLQIGFMLGDLWFIKRKYE